MFTLATYPHTDCACNETAGEEFLELITKSAQDIGVPLDINYQMKSLTWKWQLIDTLFQVVVKLGLSSSNLATSLALDEGSTALHFASASGNLRQVRWLLSHGAQDSLQIRNAAGYTPLSIAQHLGPHPQVEAALRDAIAAPAKLQTIQVRTCG